MSHTRFIYLDNFNQQIIALIKHVDNKIEVCVEDNRYSSNKLYNVFICKEEMKAISILFEKNELEDIDNFYNFLYKTFSNPNKNNFFELNIGNESEFSSYFFIGIRYNNPNSSYGLIREKYKFKLKEV